MDGGWSAFTSWGTCSNTCGDGVQERSRTCTNPAPALGGSACVGESQESKLCKLKECPGKMVMTINFINTK